MSDAFSADELLYGPVEPKLITRLPELELAWQDAAASAEPDRMLSALEQLSHGLKLWRGHEFGWYDVRPGEIDQGRLGLLLFGVRVASLSLDEESKDCRFHPGPLTGRCAEDPRDDTRLCVPANLEDSITRSLGAARAYHRIRIRLDRTDIKAGPKPFA